MAPTPAQPRSNATPALTATLLTALALQNAVPPFATDMYAPAFPAVTSYFSTTGAIIGLTLTTFFVGFGSGQVVGGAVSDSIGRRRPMLIGGLTCLVGSAICAVAPNVWVLFLGRFLQGFGGGAAAAVGRALLVDVARGAALARAMSILQAVGGLAPMVAPVAGAFVISFAPWQAIFWCLTAFSALMVLAAWAWAPESLPAARASQPNLLRASRDVLGNRTFVAMMTISSLNFFALFAYISNSSYIMQGPMGMSPTTYSFVFAGNALLSTLGAIVNARIVPRYGALRLMTVGMAMGTVAVGLIAVSVIGFDANLIATCAGFALFMVAESLIFGNAAALALEPVRESAGTASAIQGLVQAVAAAISAPLATIGGTEDPVPMALVMVGGSAAGLIAFFAHWRATKRSGS